MRLHGVGKEGGSEVFLKSLICSSVLYSVSRLLAIAFEFVSRSHVGPVELTLISEHVRPFTAAGLRRNKKLVVLTLNPAIGRCPSRSSSLFWADCMPSFAFRVDWRPPVSLAAAHVGYW